jgi:hypothetical protein
MPTVLQKEVNYARYMPSTRLVLSLFDESNLTTLSKKRTPFSYPPAQLPTLHPAFHLPAHRLRLSNQHRVISFVL